MVTISERFKFRPVKSRMSVFEDRLSMTKARRGWENQGLDLDLRLEILVIIGACLSKSEDRVLLYAVNRQSIESGGFVISWDDLRSLRKDSVSMECRRRKEWDVGGDRGIRFSDNSVKTGKWSDGEQSGGDRWCERSVRRWNDKVKSVILVVCWKVDMLSEVEGRKKRQELRSKVISRIVKVNIEVAGYYKLWGEVAAKDRNSSLKHVVTDEICRWGRRH